MIPKEPLVILAKICAMLTPCTAVLASQSDQPGAGNELMIMNNDPTIINGIAIAIPSRTAINGLKLPILAATGIMCLLTNAVKPPDFLSAIIIPLPYTTKNRALTLFFGIYFYDTVMQWKRLIYQYFKKSFWEYFHLCSNWLKCYS